MGLDSLPAVFYFLIVISSSMDSQFVLRYYIKFNFFNYTHVIIPSENLKGLENFSERIFDIFLTIM